MGICYVDRDMCRVLVDRPEAATNRKLKAKTGDNIERNLEEVCCKESN